MKSIFNLLLFCLFTGLSLAQAPQKMSYQAVVRNNSNALLTNSPVGMKISILQGSATGNNVFSELHFISTNSNGLVSLEIGGGTTVSGNFSQIDWSNGPYFIKTETDPNGGVNYTITGTTQLLSVPYALHSGTSSGLGDYAIIEEQYPLNSFPPNINSNSTAFVPNIRPLNTVVSSRGNNISLNTFSNTINIQPGLYKVHITSPAYLLFSPNQGGTDSYLTFTGTLSNNLISYYYSNSNQTVMELQGVIQVNNAEIFTLYQYVRSALPNNSTVTYFVPNQPVSTVARVFIQKL